MYWCTQLIGIRNRTSRVIEHSQGDGPFTVFAPTDQAFIDAGIDLTSLDTPEGKQTLTDILLYHVVVEKYLQLT